MIVTNLNCLKLTGTNVLVDVETVLMGNGSVTVVMDSPAHSFPARIPPAAYEPEQAEAAKRAGRSGSVRRSLHRRSRALRALQPWRTGNTAICAGTKRTLKRGRSTAFSARKVTQGRFDRAIPTGADRKVGSALDALAGAFTASRRGKGER